MNVETTLLLPFAGMSDSMDDPCRAAGQIRFQGSVLFLLLQIHQPFHTAVVPSSISLLSEEPIQTYLSEKKFVLLVAHAGRFMTKPGGSASPCPTTGYGLGRASW